MTQSLTVLRDVETASIMMRRYYRSVRETMRAMAGYLSKMQCWSAKKMLARHIWLDSMHADMLRSRTLNLRYPRVDVDDNADKSLVRILEKLPTVESDEHFLLSVYTVIKPEVLKSLKKYISGSDALDDAPSHIYLQRIIQELELQLQEYKDWQSIEHSYPDNKMKEWEKVLYDLLLQCGGIDGPDTNITQDESGYLQNSDYSVPMEGGRDPTWESAVMQVPPRPPQNMTEYRVWIAIDHANEVWAAETPAALIWEHKNMPWNLYMNAARWCYDEMRHAMMGEQRLASLGLNIGIDYPMVPDHWRAFRKKGLGALLLLLHGLEQSGPMNKSKFKKELSIANDFDGAQDCDYDWADESGHISIGLAWIKALYPKWSKEEIMKETTQLLTEWREWIQRHHREGTHGYEKFLERIEAKLSTQT